MAVIAANCASAVLPEQAGIWAYPRREGDENETVINMVSAMLFRIHLGGHLPELSEQRFELVKEAVNYYKTIRDHIADSIPYWPLGLHDFEAEWLCWGMHGKDTDYIAVVRRDSRENELYIPLCKDFVSVKIAYPSRSHADVQILKGNRCMKLCLEHTFSACILEIN